MNNLLVILFEELINNDIKQIENSTQMAQLNLTPNDLILTFGSFNSFGIGSYNKDKCYTNFNLIKHYLIPPSLSPLKIIQMMLSICDNDYAGRINSTKGTHNKLMIVYLKNDFKHMILIDNEYSHRTHYVGLSLKLNYSPEQNNILAVENAIKQSNNVAILYN